MGFLRFILEAATPLTLILLLMIGALICLLCSRRTGALVQLSLALFVLIFCGYGFGVQNRIASREHIYPAFNDDQLPLSTDHPIGYIVVLGSGHISDARLPAASRLGASSLYRLVESVRILGFFPDATLLLTGGPGLDTTPNANIMLQAARDLGIPPTRIIAEPDPDDTLQEARIVKTYTGADPFVLVTSAMHMKRAIEIFQQNGMHPIAAPTGYIVKENEKKERFSFFPDPMNMILWKNVLYEWLGTIWSRLH